MDGALKDGRVSSPDWAIRQPPIDGVRLKESRNLLTRAGATTEQFRVDWGLSANPLQHVISIRFEPGRISAWHCHQLQTDHLSVVEGDLRVILFDGREASPSFRQVCEVRLGHLRPMTLVVPPGVWHGLQNMASTTTLALNMFDRAYDYDDPDEWRLPYNTDEIPYSFKGE